MMPKDVEFIIVFDRLPQLIEQIEDRVGDAALEIAERVVRDVKASMAASGGAGTPSAPGEAPAIQEGELYASYDAKRLSKTTAAAFTTEWTAPILEFGAPGANLAPRPHLRPAVWGRRGDFEQALQRIWGRLL